MKKNIPKSISSSHVIEKKLRPASSGKSIEEALNKLHTPLHFPRNQSLHPSVPPGKRKVAQMQWAKNILKKHPDCNVVKLNIAGSGNMVWNKSENPNGIGLIAMKEQEFAKSKGIEQYNELSSSFKLASYDIQDIKQNIPEIADTENYLVNKYQAKILKALDSRTISTYNFVRSRFKKYQPTTIYINLYKDFIDSAIRIEQETNKKFEALYGIAVKNRPNVYKKRNRMYIIEKGITKELNYSTFSIAGPQSWGGVRDQGDNSIEKNIGNGVKLLDEEINKKPKRKFYVGIKGHSRDGVAASQIAKGIKAIHDKEIVEINLLMCDPVPGPMHAGINVSIDLNETYSGKDVYKATPTLASLENNTKSTLVYSLALKAKHLIGFTPQTVTNAQRIILTTDNHTCGLDQQEIDDAGKKNKRAFEKGFGGLEINNKPQGVYLFNGSQLTKLNSGNDVIEAIRQCRNWAFDNSREFAILEALLNKFPNETELEDYLVF